jgi:hypothetical protein
MIVVRVELWSAITGQKTELARMHICNVSGAGRRRDYQAQVFRGRSKAALDKRSVLRTGALTNWPSLDLHVWNMVAALLASMGYGDPKTKPPAQAGQSAKED